MYYDFTQLVNNTNTIISQFNNVIIVCWITVSVLVCITVIDFFRSVKK